MGKVAICRRATPGRLRGSISNIASLVWHNWLRELYGVGDRLSEGEHGIAVLCVVQRGISKSRAVQAVSGLAEKTVGGGNVLNGQEGQACWKAL